MSILSTKSRCMDCIIREAVEIELHPDDINRENGFCLSRSWKPCLFPERIWKASFVRFPQQGH
jgi:hypothetical protein